MTAATQSNTAKIPTTIEAMFPVWKAAADAMNSGAIKQQSLEEEKNCPIWKLFTSVHDQIIALEPQSARELAMQMMVNATDEDPDFNLSPELTQRIVALATTA